MTKFNTQLSHSYDSVDELEISATPNCSSTSVIFTVYSYLSATRCVKFRSRTKKKHLFFNSEEQTAVDGHMANNKMIFNKRNDKTCLYSTFLVHILKWGLVVSRKAD